MLVRAAAERGRRFGARVVQFYREARGLSGKPGYLVSSPVLLAYDRLRWGPLGTYIWHARRIPGWTRGKEAVALAQGSLSLPGPAVIVEIGSFLGCSSVLLAGARKLQGSGIVHCVDPFDASGDAYSVPMYHAIAGSLTRSLRACFGENVRRAGLTDWVVVHQARAHAVAVSWTEPIDLLFMDGDQSYEAVRATYRDWAPFLKPGGTIALHNSRPGRHHPSHDGHVRIAAECLRPPEYYNVVLIGSTTFARKRVR